MEPEEIVQYITFLPEYEEAEQQLNEIVFQMVRDLKPKLPGIIQATKKGVKDGNIRTLYNEANKFFGLINNDKTGCRNMMTQHITLLFWAELFSTLDDVIASTDMPFLVQVVKDLDEIWEKAQGIQFIGGQFLREKYKYRVDLQDATQRIALEDLAEKKLMTEAEKKNLKDELAIKFKEIKELRQYRKVYFSTYEIGRTKVAIVADDDIEKGQSYPGICTFQVILNQYQQLKRPRAWVNDGKKIFDHGLRPGVINFQFNQITGELGFITNHAIPLSEIMEEGQYLLLKKRLFDLLLDYLNSKDPDIEDLFLPKKNEIKENKLATNREVTEVIEPSILPPENIEEEPPIMVKPEEIFREENIAPVENSHEVDEEINPLEDKKKKLALLQRIRGIKGQKLLSALNRLMGPPERIRGSHHFFRSPHNNMIFPIPIHSATSVGFPLLRVCLDKWDIALEDFCKEV